LAGLDQLLFILVPLSIQFMSCFGLKSNDWLRLTDDAESGLKENGFD
jgi:hypothetical protein